MLTRKEWYESAMAQSLQLAYCAWYAQSKEICRHERRSGTIPPETRKLEYS